MLIRTSQTVTNYLHIEARLPHKPAGLELSARLLALRPAWDIELTEDGLSFYLSYQPGGLDNELGALEEGCGRLESLRPGLEVELRVRRVEEAPAGKAPPALGPWRLIQTAEDSAETPGPDRLLLPAGFGGSARRWAGESLLASALAEHFIPNPGAPETRGRPLLVLSGGPSAVLAAAVLAGAGPAALLSETEAGRLSAELLALNQAPPAEIIDQPFTSLSRNKRNDWAGRFGLMLIHLSPYLAARRLKSLAGWLAPEGVIMVSGFAPGPQTAHLLRAAARAGLSLSDSVSFGDWAALKLEAAPARAELPPLTGSLVPDLVDLPETPDPEPSIEDQAEETPDEDSLIIGDDEDEDE